MSEQNTSTQKGFPKFENLESLIRERENLKQIVTIAVTRIETIQGILRESAKMLQEVLNEKFTPPPISDADIQPTITKLGNLMKATITSSSNGQTKALEVPPEGRPG